MPTYDYQCDACNHTFEQFQGIKEEPKKKCPKCKKQKLKRLIYPPAGIHFKGTGWTPKGMDLDNTLKLLRIY